MAKYSYGKKKVVNSYLNGEGGYRFLAQDIRKWGTNYKAFGDEGLFSSAKRRTDFSKHV